jgi:hypothetical protein
MLLALFCVLALHDCGLMLGKVPGQMLKRLEVVRLFRQMLSKPQSTPQLHRHMVAQSLTAARSAAWGPRMEVAVVANVQD